MSKCSCTVVGVDIFYCHKHAAANEMFIVLESIAETLEADGEGHLRMSGEVILAIPIVLNLALGKEPIQEVEAQDDSG